MTEIPEHLLKRSRDRRAALGLGGGDADAGESAAPAPAAGAAVEPAAGAAPAPAAAAAAAVPEETAPEPVPHYVEASRRRHRIPVWAMPVLAGLIFWAPIYIGTLEEPPVEGGPLAAGEEVYAGVCAGCHAPDGSGGAGRQLSSGEVLATFPDWRDQVAFVEQGSPPAGTPYGDPDRPGGQHTGGSYNGVLMPAQGIPYGGGLTRLEILEVVLHERILSGENPEESELLAYIEALEASGEELPEEGDLPELQLEGTAAG